MTGTAQRSYDGINRGVLPPLRFFKTQTRRRLAVDYSPDRRIGDSLLLVSRVVERINFRMGMGWINQTERGIDSAGWLEN
jgi:hypothetical protein